MKQLLFFLICLGMYRIWNNLCVLFSLCPCIPRILKKIEVVSFFFIVFSECNAYDVTLFFFYYALPSARALIMSLPFVHTALFYYALPCPLYTPPFFIMRCHQRALLPFPLYTPPFFIMRCHQLALLPFPLYTPPFFIMRCHQRALLPCPLYTPPFFIMRCHQRALLPFPLYTPPFFYYALDMFFIFSFWRQIKLILTDTNCVPFRSMFFYFFNDFDVR